MKFGIFYEHQLPRPWNEGAEPGCSRRRWSRSNSPTSWASTTPGRSSIISSRNIRTPRRPRYSSPPARSAPRASVSATASADAAEIQSSGARRRAHRHARSGLQRPRRMGHRRERLADGARRLNRLRPVEKRRCGTRASSNAPTCWRWIPIPASGASSSRCRAAMWCRSRCRGRIRRSGSPAPSARPSSSRRVSASAR